ncbi:XisI protein [Trichodesmium erythraeum 21-75]|nr:XisI protein [Trichodesmium erythraeum 21-75]
MKINGLEDGIAKFLVNAGIPKSQIVLGFSSSRGKFP